MATYAFCFVLVAFTSIALCDDSGNVKDLGAGNQMAKGLADYAVQQIDAQSNSLYLSKLVQVTKAQVEDEVNYHLTFDLGETECSKHADQINLEQCQVKKVQQCKATVHIDPMLVLGEPQPSLTDFHCEAKPVSATPFVGGAHQGDTEDQDVKDAALFAMGALNAKSNAMYRNVMTEIKSVTKQLVAGVKYTIKLEVGKSHCRNNAISLPLEICPVDMEGEAEECEVQVWEQSWMTPRYQLTDFKCKPSPGSHKVKRHFNPKMAAVKMNPSAGSNSDAHMDKGAGQPMLGGDDHDIGHYGMFQEFKIKFNRTYANRQEELQRFAVFRANMKIAKKLQDTEQGTARYGATRFADLTEQEFKRMQGLRPDLLKGTAKPVSQAKIPSGPIPDAFDWRDHNSVTPVKNQGSCGSCWAFSVTGNIEGQWSIKRKNLLSLSEQELVDCDKLDEGCNGGLPVNAYESIMSIGGLETEEAYPYEGEDDKCSFAKAKAKVNINGYVNISSDEADMAAWLAKNGPISIGINAMAMQFYMGGVSHPFKLFCPATLDHGVLIVGYGVKDGWFGGKTPYWIIKNSWGEGWGEKGYYLIYRGDGSCGLNQMCTSATVN